MTGFVIGVVLTGVVVWAWRRYDGWGRALRGLTNLRHEWWGD